MALNISAWSIRNPLPSVVFSIILLVLGWVSFTKLAVTRLPSADIPVISVAVAQFGAAPAELESQVTKTIEDGVSGLLAPAGDAEAVGEALARVLTDDALAARLREAGPRRAAEFSTERTAEATLALYRRVLAGTEVAEQG